MERFGAFCRFQLLLVCICFGSMVQPVWSSAKASDPFPVAEESEWDSDTSQPGLPDSFLRKVRWRSIMDRYASQFHALEEPVGSKGQRTVPRYRLDERAVPVVRPSLPEEVVQYRAGIPKGLRPHPGFRAPILEDTSKQPPVILSPALLTPQKQELAEFIRRALPVDGVLPTVVRVMGRLGPERFEHNVAGAIRELSELGFPVDLLEHFHAPPEGNQLGRVSSGASGGGVGLTSIISHIAKLQRRGLSDADLEKELQRIAFVFRKTEPGFAAAEETGEHEIGLVRLQIGGGYDGGVLRGGSLDVSGQLLGTLPNAGFLASVPEEFLQNIHWMALYAWPVRKANRLTLISEPIAPAAWAQDNGKAGLLTRQGSSERVAATLAPRFASRMETRSIFSPGESFLMDGLQTAGHTVIHSPLLFQGGSLLVVRDPARNERVLLMSETELFRNVSLGLKQDQVLAAFRIEFGVDRCVVLPALSYHLDYDITLRLHEGRIIAFMNDAEAAARIIVREGLAALEKHTLLGANSAKLAREQLAKGNFLPVLLCAKEALAPHRKSDRGYSGRLARVFAVEPADFPGFNLQCFLAALDFLESKLPEGPQHQGERVVTDYWLALREMEEMARAQRAVVEGLGWEVVLVPSMPDLYRSINYLNGLQDRNQYLMPVIGGFYKVLDDAAATVFEKKLGREIKIARIYSADIQQSHGGLHCVASVFPRTEK